MQDVTSKKTGPGVCKRTVFLAGASYTEELTILTLCGVGRNNRANLGAMAPNLTAMAPTLLAMASNLIAMGITVCIFD